MRSRAFLYFLAVPLFAIDGMVVNKTTGKPQSGVAVTLMDLSRGMSPVETAKSGADGKFAFTKDVQGAFLLQASFKGVTYNQMVQPGMPSSALSLDIFDAVAQPGATKVTQHMILLEPSSSQLQIRETYVYSNPGNQTWNNPGGGTLRFWLPEEAAGKAQIMATAPRGMPVERSAEKTPQAGVYMVNFPIKPGESRIDLAYRIPFTSPGKYSGRIVQPLEATMLVAPDGVTLKGEGLEAKGREPSSQASVFKVTGAKFTVEIQGTGEMQAAGSGDAEEGPGIEEIPARIHERMYLVLAITIAILAMGLLLHYRVTPADTKTRERR
jgi:hypothetical protein